VRISRGCDRNEPPDAASALSRVSRFKFFEDVILADLRFLQQFNRLKTARTERHWPAAAQDFVRAPLLEFRRHYRAPLDRVHRSIARSLEARIVDEFLPIQRAARCRPIRHPKAQPR